MCPLMSNKDVAREFNEIKDAVGQTGAYDIWSKNNGNGIDKAPNGEPSILFSKLLDICQGVRNVAIKIKSTIYKKSFLKSFGNWIEGLVSKDNLDQNGEPTLEQLLNTDTDGQDTYLKKDQPRYRIRQFKKNLKPKSSYRPKRIQGFGTYLTERFISQLGVYLSNKIGYLYEGDLQDFYDNFDFFLDNEIEDFIQNQIDKLEEEYRNLKFINTKQLTESLKKQYFEDLKILREGRLTGNYETDVENLGLETTNRLKKKFPAIYKKGYSVKLANFYRHLSNLDTSLKDGIKDANDNNIRIFQIEKSLEKLNTIKAALSRNGYKTKNLIRNLVNKEIINYFSAKSRQEQSNDVKSTIQYNETLKDEDYDNINAFTIQQIFPKGLDHTYTISEVLENIKNSDERYRELCEYLLSRLKGDVDINIKNNNNASERASLGGAAWTDLYGDINFSTIMLSKNSTLFANDPAYVAMHEIMHSFSSGVIKNDKILEKSIQEYIDYIEKYYRFHKSDEGAYSYGFLQGSPEIYGLKNPQEFLAEYFSNPNFQEFLKQIPPMESGKFESLFHDILEHILNWLGIKTSDNAYDQIKPVLEDIIDITTQYEFSNITNHPLFDVKGLVHFDRFNLQEFSSSEYSKQQDEFISTKLKAYIRKNIKLSKEKLKSFINYAKLEFNNQQQQKNINHTRQTLIEAFGLTESVDENGNRILVSKKTEDGKYDVVVEFVSHLYDEDGEHQGWYDYNAKSLIAHHVIKIAMDDEDPSTLDHELAHHYVKLFWNSPLIQNALGAVYKKGMTNDEVEEALVQQITVKTQILFSQDVEQKSFVSKFWSQLNKMLADGFNIKTKRYKEDILNSITNSFMINEQQIAVQTNLKHEMSQNRMYYSKDRRAEQIQQKRKAKRAERYNNPYTIVDISRKDQDLIKTIVNGVFGRKNILGQFGNISGKMLAKLNTEAEKVKDFVDAIQLQRQLEKENLKSMGVSDKKANTESANTKRESELNAQLIYDVIRGGLEDVDEAIDIFNSAEMLHYTQIAYKMLNNEDGDFGRSYITDINEMGDPGISVDKFDEDKLQTYGKEIVSYYKSICEKVSDFIVAAPKYGLYTEDEIRTITDAYNNLNSKVTALSSQYNAAVEKIVERRLIEYIDENTSTLDEEEKEALKNTVRRWINTTSVNLDSKGIRGTLENFVGHAEYMNSPVVRMVHSMIQDMMMDTHIKKQKKEQELKSAKRKAKKALLKHFNLFSFSSVDKLFVETDEYGLPDGNFLDEYDRGKYFRLRNEFLNNVLFENGWEDEDGNHHEAIEKQIKRITGDDSYELEITDLGEPIIEDDAIFDDIYMQYLKAQNHFLSKYTIRPYTNLYYAKRLELLSVKTIKAEQQAQDEINKILKLCMVNGKPHTENLTHNQAVSLLEAYRKKNQLSSPYDEFGVEKQEGTVEHQIYKELKAWNEWKGDRISYKRNDEAYNSAKSAADDERDFEMLNSYKSIASEFYEELDSISKRIEDPTGELEELKQKRSKLISIIKDRGLTMPRFDEVWDEDNKRIRPEYEQFFLNLKDLDQKIAEREHKLTKGKKRTKAEKDKIASMIKRFDYRFTDGSKKISWISHMIRSIKDRESNETKALNEIEKYLTYKHPTKGTIALSIFSYSHPIGTSRTHSKTGKVYDTIERIPINVYSEIDPEKSDEELVNKEYYKRDLSESIQLTDEFKNKKYEELMKMPKEVVDYYKLLKSTTKEAIESLGFMGDYNGMLPQIGMRATQGIGRYLFNAKLWRKDPIRALRAGFSYLFKRIWNINETDGEFNDSSWSIKNDGSLSRKIPLRYVKRLQHSDEISTNLVGTVTALYEMATDYNAKRKISPILNTIYYNSWNRNGDHGTSSQTDQLKFLINKNIYDKSSEWMDKNRFGRSMKWLAKHSVTVRSFAMIGLLGGSLSSATVALLDGAISSLKDVVVGKFANRSDLFYAYGKLAGNLPNGILQLGSTKNNYVPGDVASAMQFYNLTKTGWEQLKDADQSFLTRFTKPDRLLMSLFGLADYHNTAVYMLEVCHNYKLYKGQFLREREFMKQCAEDGLSEKDAQWEYQKAICLWESMTTDKKGRYRPNTKTVGGKALYAMSEKERRKLFTNVHKRVESRASLYNGSVYKTARTNLQSNILTGWVTMCRNFMVVLGAHKLGSLKDFYTYPTEGELDGETIRAVEIDQHYNYGGFNFMTGDKHAPEIQASFNALFRTTDSTTKRRNIFVDIYKNLKRLLNYYWVSKIKTLPSKLKTGNVLSIGLGDNVYQNASKEFKEDVYKKYNVSEAEITAINTLLTGLTMIAILTLVSTLFHNKFSDDYDDEWWFQMLDLILLRLPVEHASGYTWATFTELIKTISAGQSPLENFQILPVIMDLVDMVINDGEKANETVNSGVFEGRTKFEKDVINLFTLSGVRNIYKNTHAKALKRTKKFYEEMDLGVFPNPSMFWKDKDNYISELLYGTSDSGDFQFNDATDFKTTDVDFD